MKSSTLAALWLMMGIFPTYAYQKKCYIHPQYGRKGSLQDLKCMLGKHLDEGCKHDYEVCSLDGRRTCRIRLSKSEVAHTKLFLDGCTCAVDTPIADEMVQGLLNSKKGHLKTVGLILRDFKYHNKHVTVQQVRYALGIPK